MPRSISSCTVGLLLLLPLCAFGAQCRKSADCDDKQDCTVDYCDPVTLKCLNIAAINSNSSRKCKPNTRETTKERILSNAERFPLPLSARLSIISVAKTIFQDIHPHRKLHMNFKLVDPIGQLEQIRRDHLRTLLNPKIPKITEVQFHQRMFAAFKSVKDLHTTYVERFKLGDFIALLPFLVREFYEMSPVNRARLAVNGTSPARNGSRSDGQNKSQPFEKYIVTETAVDAQFSNAQFKKGVEIVSWNGVSMAEAVRISGEAGYGNNKDSKLLSGLRRLTRRMLANQLLPEQVQVNIGFKDLKGKFDNVTVPWIYARVPRPMLSVFATSGAVFLSPVRTVRRTTSTKSASNLTSQAQEILVNPQLSDSLEGEVITTSKGRFGIITLFNFLPILNFRLNNDGFIFEFRRYLNSLPQNGVVIDVRGNDGGDVRLCQEIIQYFTANRITPVGFSLRSTIRLLSAADRIGINSNSRLGNIDPAVASRAAAFGDQFFNRFRPFQETSNAFKGKRYPGPVVVLTDSETYSCGDVFAAAVQDNDAGLVIGVHDSTGGGGSTVVSVDRLVFSLGLQILPFNTDIRTSLFRIERARKRSGVPIEYFGVSPDIRYRPTRRDRVDGDKDFYEFIATQLAKLRSRN